ncbi:hypothetical protein [Pseudomonas sp. H3_C08]
MEYMYRFRSVDRLMGKNGEEGELEGQYIFFASPEQLNDPMEGYKDVYFQGDSVIWINLIKHYIRCLIDSCMIYLISPDEIPSAKIGVFASALHSNDKLNSINITIYNHLITEPALGKFISNMAVKRKVRRWELCAYLQTIHTHLLGVIFNTFYDVKITPVKFSYFMFGESERLEMINRAADALIDSDELTADQEASFQKSFQKTNEKKLLTQLRTEGKGKDFWFFLLFDYPEVFCKDIERLVYPEWYIACFMSSCADSAIWGSYGGHHKDVCLKYKVNKNEGQSTLKLKAPNGQNSSGVTWGTIDFTFHEVSYENSFVDIDFFRSMGHLSVPNLSRTWFIGEDQVRSICAEDMFRDENLWRDNYWKNFYHSVTVKLQAWDREKESRLILTSPINNLEDVSMRKLKYDFSSLEGIIFGINTSTKDKIKIIKKVSEICGDLKREEFSFYQARYDKYSREIIYDKLESISPKSACT